MHLSIPPNPDVAFKVRHEDTDLVVVDKPAHVVTQPGKGHEHDTLLNGLFSRWGPRLQNLGRDRDFGLLHRLDRETSGLIVVALSSRAYDAVRAAFENRSVHKFYLAIVARTPLRPTSVIRRPISEYTESGPGGKKLARVAASGKPAITAYRVLSAANAGAALECRAVTGRLHQVRVHLASIACPIVGDGLYADPAVARAAPRLALHAWRLRFEHPVSHTALDVRSPWPADLKRVLKRFGLSGEVVEGPSDAGAENSDVEPRT